MPLWHVELDQRDRWAAESRLGDDWTLEWATVVHGLPIGGYTRWPYASGFLLWGRGRG